MPNAKMLYNDDRKLWDIVVYEGNLILDFGCESTRTAAVQWARKALLAYTISPGPHTIPDAYDRGERQYAE